MSEQVGPKQTDNQLAIECSTIKKSFVSGTTTIDVLRGINFAARQHELVMLMGPSGSGKTTLLSIMGGLLTPTSGECLILKKNINDLSERKKTQFRGQSIGFLFQYFNLVPTITAVENAVIPLLLQGVSRKQAFAQGYELLETVGLAQQKNYMIEKLSGGEKQRVALVRAFIHKPKVILCDEPTSFLDHERGVQIMQLIRTIQQETGAVVIVVTHDVRILDFADRIIEIEDGVIVERNR